MYQNKINTPKDYELFKLLKWPLKLSCIWTGVLAISLMPLSSMSKEDDNTLNLEAYLNQVQKKNDNYKAYDKNIEAYQLLSHESDLLTDPIFFSSLQYISDYKPNPIFKYEKYLSSQLQFGVQQQTSYGTQAKISYTYNSLQYVPLSSTLAQTGTLLEISQSLWRNSFGAETKAQQEAASSATEAQKFAESYKQKATLAEAEANYWRLALARQARQVSQDAFDRAKKIFDYSENKSKLGLADQSDFLQATAALEARRLDLKMSQEEQDSASRAFNASRGIDDLVVPESLPSLNEKLVEKIQRQTALQTRDDVKAAQSSLKATQASARASSHKSKPTLELYGQLGLNGQDADPSTSMNQSWSTGKPTQVIGIKFSMPLDTGLLSNNISGYRQQEQAAQYSFERKLFEQDRDWHELNHRYDEAKSRLDLITKLESAQKAKLDNEKIRHTKGRTTLVNVLNFEVDYLVAQLSKIKTLTELLQLHAQLKLFGENYESR